MRRDEKKMGNPAHARMSGAMSSAHQNKSGQVSDYGIARCAGVAPPPQRTDRTYTGIAGFTRTHNLRPAEKSTDKRRTGNTCSTTDLLRHIVPKAGLEPATTSL